MASGHIFEIGDKIMANAIHVTNLAEYVCHFERQNKSNIINGKDVSVYNNKTTTRCNSHYIYGQYDLGNGVII